MPIEFNRRAPVRCSLAAAVLATLVAAPGAADARRVASASIGAYDGTWNVVFSTKAGNCSATNSAPFAVSGRRIQSAGGGKVTGGINARAAFRCGFRHEVSINELPSDFEL